MTNARRRRTLCVAAAIAAAAACGAGATEPQAPAPAAPLSQAPPPVAASAATPTFDAGRAWEHLQRQVAFGPRPAGSAALEECRRYLLDQLRAIGLEPREQAFSGETPVGPIRMVNLSATIPGRRPERIILASHYDTKLFRDVRFVGASDGASSTAALLELGRALAGRQGEFTIELLFLDGEEAVIEWAGNDNTYGSRHYVEEARRTGSLGSIRAFVLLDMIGDKDLDIRRDSYSTPWLVDIVWAAAARLGHRSTFVNELTTIEDDHLPFLRAGIPSIDIIDLNYAAWHTPEDDLDRVSADSLQIVGDVVLAALPDIEQRLASSSR